MPGLTRFLTNTITTDGGGSVFADTGPGTVIVDANAYRIAMTGGNRGLDLSGDSWGVTVNGRITAVGGGAGGVGVRFGSITGTSSVTVGSTGSIHSRVPVFESAAISSNNNLTVKKCRNDFSGWRW